MKSLYNLGLDAPGPVQLGVLQASGADPLGAELKQMFGLLTAGPLPDRMVQLADALDEAFGRGELFDHDKRRLS